MLVCFTCVCRGMLRLRSGMVPFVGDPLITIVLLLAILSGSSKFDANLYCLS